MIAFILTEKRTGYEVIEDYIIRKFGECNYGCFKQYIVNLETSYDGIHWTTITDIVQTDFISFEWGIDWYEGEKYIRLFGIKDIEDIDIIGEGV